MTITRKAAIGIGVGAAGLLAGGVLAAGIVNFSTGMLMAGQDNVTNCYDPNHASVQVQADPSWNQATGVWSLGAANLIIDDSASGAWVACGGQTVTVTAVDANGAALGSGQAVIPTDGNVNVAVTLTPVAVAADAAKWGAAIDGPHVDLQMLNFTYPTTTLNLTQSSQVLTPYVGGRGFPVWSATGLPTGVSINSVNGDITGPVNFRLPATEAAVGRNHACARDGGQVYCWGSNSDFQVGNTETTRFTPQTTSVTNATDIAAGGEFTCAVRAGQVWCWGSNEYGELGIGTYGPGTRYATPQQVQGITNATEVVAGDAFACANDSGTVKCWGLNTSGQTGTGSFFDRVLTATAVNLPGGYTAASMSAGVAHACLVTIDDKLYCWGRNNNGQLGVGDTLTKVSPAAGPTDVASVAAGSDHTCITTTTNGVECAGSNTWGQLGTGSYGGWSEEFLTVGSATATKVSAGQWYSCLTATDNTVKCWGYGGNGQLGNGSNLNASSPVNVSGAAGTVYSGQYNSCTIQAGNLQCWGASAYGVNGNANGWLDNRSPGYVASPGYPASVTVQAADNVSGEVYRSRSFTLNLAP